MKYPVNVQCVVTVLVAAWAALSFLAMALGIGLALWPRLGPWGLISAGTVSRMLVLTIMALTTAGGLGYLSLRLFRWQRRAAVPWPDLEVLLVVVGTLGFGSAGISVISLGR